MPQRSHPAMLLLFQVLNVSGEDYRDAIFVQEPPDSYGQMSAAEALDAADGVMDGRYFGRVIIPTESRPGLRTRIPGDDGRTETRMVEQKVLLPPLPYSLCCAPFPLDPSPYAT